jgi:hypothetical protein
MAPSGQLYALAIVGSKNELSVSLYRRIPVSAGNTFQGLQRLRETADNTERYIQGGSNMTGTDLCVNKPHCAAAVRPY